ncbi:MAG TPA: hypothetical protein VK766_04585 [Cytophagaceae bacterium]|jgi:hypothetical protein|nr:hypothetical protein [Cytophagaceae bacterium]
MVFTPRLQAFLLFLLISTVLIIRDNVESTSYCTPDSKYYLEVSKNILSGLGPVGPKAFEYNESKTKIFALYDSTSFGHPETYQKEYFAIWPLGYPICIVVISYLSGLEPVWASKLVNILLLALDFYLIYLLFGNFHSLSLFYFCSFTMLEITSYTWSENLFIPFFLLLILSLKYISETDFISLKNILLLATAMAGMCLARYASVIFFLSPIIMMVWYFRKKEYSKTKSIFFGLLISSFILGLYLFNNYTHTGYLTGMPRVNTQENTLYNLTIAFFMGIFHQIHIIKQFRFSGTVDFLLYLVLTLIQVCLMVYVGYHLMRTKIVKGTTVQTKLLLYSGFLYLLFLIYMTSTSTIDPFDYRTLLPFSFPIALALLSEMEERLYLSKKYKLITAVKIFFLLSLFLNLPKKYLVDLIF